MSKEIKSVEYGLEKIFEDAQDFLPLLGTDCSGNPFIALEYKPFDCAQGDKAIKDCNE